MKAKRSEQFPQRCLEQADLLTLTREQLVEIIEAQREAGIKISFSGKANAGSLSRRVRPRTLREIKKYGVGSEEARARNLVIEGDKLQAMATLYRDHGHVDLILADPPYNTGQDFRYNDRWETDPNDTGLGEFVREDDAGRSTKWMRFMYPRLQLMKSMLKSGGVLAICIDHRELFHLGQMLDELFKGNRLGSINWQKSYAPRNDNTHLSTATEYVLVYAREVEQATTDLLPRTAAHNSRYGNPDQDPEGDWREHDLAAATPSPPNQYGIQSPLTGQVYYPPGVSSWRRRKTDIKAWLEEWGTQYEERDIGDGRAPALMVVGGQPGKVPAAVAKRARERHERGQWPFIWFGLTGSGGPRVKRYLSKVKKGIVPMTYWADAAWPGTNRPAQSRPGAS